MIPLKRVIGEKRAIVVPLLVALAANVVLYSVAVYPLSRRVGSAEERAATARAARQAAEREQTAARATLEGKDRADRELRKFYADVLPANQAAARRITYLRLDRMAREAGLEPGRTNFAAKAVRDSSLTELETTAELTGDYRSIRRFLYQLETSPEFTIIQNLALASSEEGQLRLTLSLATYYRTSGDGD